MPITQVRGETQIMDNSVDLSRLFDPFLTATEGDWDITGGANGFTVTGIRDPTADDDTATKGYVDNLINGLAWKDPAVVCSETDIAIANGLEDGDTVDGIVVSTGERVLLKGQTNSANDEIQTIEITGSPTGGTWILELQISGLAQIDTAALAFDITDTALETAIDTAASGVIPGWTNGDIAVSGTDILNVLTLAFSGASVDEKNHRQSTADLTNLTGGTPAFGSLTSIQGNALGSENGVYDVAASGAASRSSDWAAGADAANFAIFVQQGTTCADRAYVVTNDTPDAIVDSDAIVLVQFSAESQVPTFVFSDTPTVTNGVATVTLANTNVVANTERVFLNGVRQQDGGGNDYTIVDSSGVITFNFNLKNTPGQLDIVSVDYHL